MLEILNYGGAIAAAAGALALIIAQIRTNSTRASTARVWQEAANSWKEEAEAQKSRADRLINELEGVKHELEALKTQTKTLVGVLSVIDPQRLEELRTQRGLQ